MRTGWVSKIGPLKVDPISGCMRTHSSVNTGAPPAGLGHTTEGGWDSAISVFRSRLTAPHLQVQKKRVGQCVPLGEMAAALQNQAGGVETNSIIRLQIEVVEFSKTSPWISDADTVETLAHIIVWAKDALGIPMDRAFDSDDLGPTPWATESYSRRHAGKWGHTAGWFMHVEAPENSHWDMGQYKWKIQMKAAHDLVSGASDARSLIVREPPMKGDDVVSAKKLLLDNPYGKFNPGNTDRLYGFEAGQATFVAKKFLGYPAKDVNTVFGPQLRAYLSGKEKLPAAFRARRLRRLSNYPFTKKPNIDASERNVHLDMRSEEG